MIASVMIALRILTGDGTVVVAPPSLSTRSTVGLSDLAGRVPHLAYPLRLSAGRLEVVEQDTVEDVRQCVYVLLRTPRGARPLAPDVGIDDPTFTGGVDAPELAAELERQEERAEIEISTGGPDFAGREQVTVRVGLAGSSNQEVA